MTEIAIIERKKIKGPISAGIDTAHVADIWGTCLRQILFLQPCEVEKVPSLDGDLILVGEEAIAYVLSVICGLQSPILGETEVMGQFKIFVASASENAEGFVAKNQKLFHGLMAEAKEVRHKFLRNLGSQSYGSLTRKALNGRESVAVLGTGHLAFEILPYLQQAERIEVLTSRLRELPDLPENARLKSYSDGIVSDQIVVAAPVSNRVLLQLIRSSSVPVRRIIDWRGETSLDKSVIGNIEYLSWPVLQNSLERNKLQLEEVRTTVMSVLNQRAKEILSKIMLRPLG